MRHLKAGRKLGRTHSHRKATLSALSVALIQNKRIKTTTAKAKEARLVVEKLITRAKRAVQQESDGKPKDVHARREVFALLRNRSAVSTLFNEIAAKVASRPGGYTRVVKLGQRHGDGAEVAMLELVDYNTGQEKATTKPKAAATRKKTEKKAKTKPPATETQSGSEPSSAEAEQTNVSPTEAKNTEPEGERQAQTKV